MNKDLIYEIFRWLYLAPEENGGPLLAKKLYISKKYRSIGSSIEKLDKPIVFDIYGESVSFDTPISFMIDVIWDKGAKI
jgi:hypothetical protein